MSHTTEHETIILTQTQKATKALESAAKALSLDTFTEAVASISEEVALKAKRSADLTVEINEKMAALEADYAAKEEGLAEQYNNKVRRHEIDFGLKIEENEEKELKKLLNARGVVTISEIDKAQLESDATYSEEETESQVAEAVKSAENSAAISKSSALKEQASIHKVAVAQNEAELGSLKEKVAFLQTALDEANKKAAAELAARIEIASKSSQPVINIESKK